MATHTQVSLVGDVDRAKQVPPESIYQEHVNSIPAGNRYKLKEKLDFESGDLDMHLEKIADSMINWREKLAILLGLSEAEVHVIRCGNQNQDSYQQ